MFGGLTCSHVWRGRYEDAVASSTAPRGLHVLAVRLTELVRWFDLQSADFFCLSDLRSAYQPAFGLYPLLFYKESALFLGFYSGFTSREYHVIRVDFIVALRRTKGRRRRTLRSPSPPVNHACVVHWTPPPHPGESAAAGHICCRGLGAI